MQTYLTTQVTDPAAFESYINQIAGDPAVAQVVQQDGGQSFQLAIEATSQTLQKEAEVNHVQLTNAVTQIQREIFTTSNTSSVEQTLPQPIQDEIQQIKQEVPVAQIPQVTVEAVVQISVPSEPAPAPASVPVQAPVQESAPAPAAPEVKAPAAPAAPGI
jgi:hypothetical protein